MRLLPRITPALLLLATLGCGPVRAPESQAQRQQRYEASLAQGSACLADRRYDQAARAFEEAVRCRPDSAQGQALLGFSYLKAKRTDAAGQALRKAVSLDPMLVAAWCNLGAVEVRTRHYLQARDCLLRATALDPTFAPAQYSLGNLLMNLGDLARGRQALEQAFALDPSLADLPDTSAVGFPGGAQTLDVCLGYARVLAAAGNAEGALRYLDRARELGFRDWKVLLAEKDFDPIRKDAKVQHLLGDPGSSPSS